MYNRFIPLRVAPSTNKYKTQENVQEQSSSQHPTMVTALPCYRWARERCRLSDLAVA